MFGKPDTQRLQQLEEENRRLKRAVDELSVLNELSREIGASLDSEEVMEHIVKRSLKALRGEQGVITLMDQEASEPTRTLIRTSSSSGKHPPFRANDQLLGWMYLNREPLMVNDPPNDERFRGAGWSEHIRSILCVPLFVRSRLIGVLTLFNKKDDEGFTDDDRRLLTIIASQSAQVIENTRLYEEERALLRVREELRLAADIQMRLLPDAAPQLDGYELAGTSIPAQNIGGDYFDFLPFGDGRVAVCVADVSGKGLPAALLMSNVQAALRARYDTCSSPAACLAVLSRLLYRSTHRGSFVTMIYGIVDPAAHSIAYANAGHNRPLVCMADGRINRLETAGLVLGAIADSEYSAGTTELEPGSVLLLYSDGVTEAMNEARAEYGEDRLENLLRDGHGMSAQQTVDRIVKDVRSHVGKAAQHDDMTLLVVKRRNSTTVNQS